jgi:hypothetical protein
LVPLLDVEESADQLEVQPVAAGDLLEQLHNPSAERQVLVQRRARIGLADRLGVYPGQPGFDFVLVDHPDAADLLQFRCGDELQVLDVRRAVGADPGLGFQEFVQPVFSGWLGCKARDGGGRGTAGTAPLMRPRSRRCRSSVMSSSLRNSRSGSIHSLSPSLAIIAAVDLSWLTRVHTQQPNRLSPQLEVFASTTSGHSRRGEAPWYMASRSLSEFRKTRGGPICCALERRPG